MRNLILAVVVTCSSLASAQAVRNGVERLKDRQDLRQDRRQQVDDRMDAARARQLLAEYDQAIAANNAGRLNAIEASFSTEIARELRESRVESAQARQEVREDQREVRSDRREVGRDVATGKGPGALANDVHDTNRDRRNTADDRGDAVKERLSRERLEAISAQSRSLAGRFDANAVQQKRALYAELVTVAFTEIRRDAQETREDHRELREDRRQR